MFTAAAAAEGLPGGLCDTLIVLLASPDQLMPCCIADRSIGNVSIESVKVMILCGHCFVS
jgi:hypothetical protein